MEEVLVFDKETPIGGMTRTTLMEFNSSYIKERALRMLGPDKGEVKVFKNEKLVCSLVRQRLKENPEFQEIDNEGKQIEIH